MDFLKKCFKSRTLWINVVGAAVILVQGHYTGFVIPADTQALILTALNFANRFLTNKPVSEK